MRTKFYMPPWDNCLHVVFIDERDGELYTAKPIELTFQPHAPGTPIEPTFKIPQAENFLREAMQFANEQKIKPESESWTKGKLDATLYHLEDLRMMLKLK